MFSSGFARQKLSSINTEIQYQYQNLIFLGHQYPNGRSKHGKEFSGNAFFSRMLLVGFLMNVIQPVSIAKIEFDEDGKSIIRAILGFFWSITTPMQNTKYSKLFTSKCFYRENTVEWHH